MPITCDPQLEALANICAYRMNRATAGSCAKVVLYAPYDKAATTAPMLFAYRVSEKIERWGTGNKYGRVATCKLLYVLKPTGTDTLDTAAYNLSWAVEMMFDAILNGSESTYAAGVKMETLAEIEQCDLVDVTYNLDTELPQVELTVVMRHRWTRTAGTATAITEMTGNLDLNADLDGITVETYTSHYLTMTPLVEGVDVVLQTGATASVAVSGDTVTITGVAATTTLAAMAALIAASTAAKAMITLTGTAGVMFDAAYGPTTYQLSRPITRQTSTV